MTLAHARALLDAEPHIEPCDPQRDMQSLHKLAVWATRYSPTVAVDPPDGLLIDITGCQRFFRGEKRLAGTMIRDLNRLGFHARVAIASTFACASAVARVEPWFVSIVPSGQERVTLGPLPLETLRIDQAVINALHEIEIVRIGQLFDLPRSQLADRYGEELLLRLDQALGEALEAIEPVRLKTPPRVEHVFDGPVLQIEGIELMTHSLLERLAEQLLKQERGVCRLDVELKRIDVSPIRLMIRLSHPSRSVKHVWSLLRPKIENVNLGFGIEQITLTASRTGVLAHEQQEMEPRMDTDGHGRFSPSVSIRVHPWFQSRTGELIDTLSNRLGADRVLRAEPFESHVPERSFRMRSATEPFAPDFAGRNSTDVDRPTLLFSTPASISVTLAHEAPSRLTWQGEEVALINHIGPEAIASEWWKESASGLREYYKVQDERGRWLWIYFQHASARWFLHGVWA